MYEYDEYYYNDLSLQNVNNVNDVNADQDPCFPVRGGLMCRDFRRGIECFHPRFGRSFCRRFR